MITEATASKAGRDSVDPAEMSGRPWQFSRNNGQIIAPVLLLHANGLVGGYLHNNERRWDVYDGKLRFLDTFGIPTSLFDQTVREGGRLTALTGYFIPDPQAIHTLIARSFPDQPNAPPVPGDRRAIIEERRSARPGPVRRNLAIVRAGSSSLHTQWPRDFPPEHRNWDLMISWYEDHPYDWADEPEYVSHQPMYKIKWRAFYDLSQPDSPLWNYDYIAIFDDDLLMSWRDVNRMFEICHRSGLQLAQPSLDARSFINHAHTRQNPAYILRFTDFVEGMAPVFSRSALRACRECFKDTVFGFGIDHLWPTLIGSVGTQCAIIDEVSMLHTRKMASRYNLGAAIAEDRGVLSLYQIRQQYRVFGGVLRDCPCL